MPPVYPLWSYPAKVVADGAVAYWRLNETSGTTAVDVIGAKNGTIAAGVTLGQTGALADGDKAMRFNGTTGKITAPVVPFTATLTLEAWIWTSTGLQMPAMSNRVAGNDFVYFGVGGDARVFMYVFPAGAVTGGARLDDSPWHPLVATSAGGTKTRYVEGVGGWQA